MNGLLFLSHAGPDTEVAAQLRRAILATPAAKDAGLDVWLDVEDIGPGDWQSQIEDGLNRATAFA
ncbi:MAG: toll/interleukin-1 receptor domain-containing protein, partial [Pseudomonadota bacterium]